MHALEHPCSLGRVPLLAQIYVIYVTQQEDLLSQAAVNTIVFCVYYLLHRAVANNKYICNWL